MSVKKERYPECIHFLVTHCFPTAAVATTASSPNTSSTLLSSTVPQIFHFSSFAFNIILCKTTYSTIFFSLVVSLARPFAVVLSRLCTDCILTITWYSADFSISSETMLVLTIRGEPIYLCRVHCRLSLGGRTLIRVRNEARSPSWHTLFKLATSPLIIRLGCACGNGGRHLTWQTQCTFFHRALLPQDE